VAVEAPTPSAGARAEPVEWPPVLDVLARSRVGEVLDAYRSAPHAMRAVRRLLPAGGPGSRDDGGVGEFLDYLLSRDRAGLVRIPRGGGVGHPRDLHLLAPDEGVARALGLGGGYAPRPGERSLLAVVTPARD
jgi:hypothetical protein